MQSWRKVAQALGLGSPGAARRAYSSLVRPHTASVLPGRAIGAKVERVTFGADTNLATLREALTGRTVVVQRKDHTEDISPSPRTPAPRRARSTSTTGTRAAASRPTPSSP